MMCISEKDALDSRRKNAVLTSGLLYLKTKVFSMALKKWKVFIAPIRFKCILIYSAIRKEPWKRPVIFGMSF